MKNKLFLFVFALLLNGTQLLAQEINWMTIEEAEAATKKEPKKYLLTCIPIGVAIAKKWTQQLFKDKALIEYLNKEFYCVKMDGEDKNTLTFKEKEFNFVDKGRRGYNELPANLLKGKLSYPTFVYLDEELKVLLMMPGYRKAKEMLSIVTYLGDDIYKDMKWGAYAKQAKGK